MILKKINWTEIFFTVISLLVLISLLTLIFYQFFAFIKVENPSWKDVSIKTQNVLMPEVHLHNKDDCASVIVTSICNNGVCEYHVNSFQTLCSEVLSGEESKD